MASQSDLFTSAGILMYDLMGKPVRVMGNVPLDVQVQEGEQRVDILVRVTGKAGAGR